MASPLSTKTQEPIPNIRETMTVQKTIATEADLCALEEGLEASMSEELRFIFANHDPLKDTLVVTFDSQTIFTWQHVNGRFRREDFALRVEISDEFSNDWWCAGLILPELSECLPDALFANERPVISGALLTPFVGNQTLRARPLSPYVTRESYLATIVHEFGHIYFDRFVADSPKPPPLHHPSVQDVRDALELYRGLTPIIAQEPAWPVNRHIQGEMFAFCVDRAASSLMWPRHKDDVDRHNIHLLETVLQDFETRGPELLRQWGQHYQALVFGPLYMHVFGGEWPVKAIQKES